MKKLLMVTMLIFSTFCLINATSNNEEVSDYKMAIQALKEYNGSFREQVQTMQAQIESLDTIESRTKEKFIEAFDKLDQGEAMIGLPKGFIIHTYSQAMPLILDFIEIIPTELLEPTTEEKSCWNKKLNLFNEFLKAGDNTESRNTYAEKAAQIYTQCYETDKISLQKGFAIATDPVAAIEKLGEEKFNKMTAAFKAKFQEKQPEIESIKNKILPYIIIVQLNLKAQAAAEQAAAQQTAIATANAADYQNFKDQN